MTDLPDTHRRALGWLAQRGGEGVIDQHGRVVAQGEKFSSAESAQVWLRLVTTGHVEGAGRHRLRLTADGRMIGSRQPRPFEQHAGRPHGRRMVDDTAEEFA
jgi:hypothetical protein